MKEIKQRIIKEEFKSMALDVTGRAKIARCIPSVVSLYDTSDFTIYDGAESLLDSLGTLGVLDEKILTIVEKYFKK